MSIWAVFAGVDLAGLTLAALVVCVVAVVVGLRKRARRT
jgi:hypothetical protein